jgi:hypothetical protein
VACGFGWSITLFAMFDGIAKPMPMLPPTASDLRGDADQLTGGGHQRTA